VSLVIVLCSVAILTKQRPVWFGGMPHVPPVARPHRPANKTRHAPPLH
jgi:hypothetical protein